jgi:hypothetical protein
VQATYCANHLLVQYNVVKKRIAGRPSPKFKLRPVKLLVPFFVPCPFKRARLYPDPPFRYAAWILVDPIDKQVIRIMSWNTNPENIWGKSVIVQSPRGCVDPDMVNSASQQNLFIFFFNY